MSKSTITNVCIGTAPSLILDPSKLLTSEAPARITKRVMRYAPLKPLKGCPNAYSD